jgi:hypothetical protein
MNRYLTTNDEVRNLPLRGATLTQVRVASTYIDLIFEMSGSGTGEIRVEARGTVTASGDSRTSEAGPALGSSILSLLDAQVENVESDDLDLMLTFGQGRVLALHVDGSGYESYSVTLGGDTWVAIRSAE